MTVRVLDKQVEADLIPGGPKITAMIEVNLQNTSSVHTLKNLTIPHIKMYVCSTDEYVGTMPTSTTWTADLAPGESDTVTLHFENEEPRSTGDFDLVTVRRINDSFVILEIEVHGQYGKVITARADSTFFRCSC